MAKMTKKITNWPEYNKALVNRGSITFWVDRTVTEQWLCEGHHGGRGRSCTFSDMAIESMLMLKGVFNLPLWALQGFVDSIFDLMQLTFRSPSYSCVSKRSRDIQVQYRPQPKGRPIHLLLDGTGLKVMGEGEWCRKKHGIQKRRTFRKLHLAVDDATHDIVSAQFSTSNVADNEVIGDLLRPLRWPISQVTADGAYDTRNTPLHTTTWWRCNMERWTSTKWCREGDQEDG
jgi:hypothetical protein